MAGFVWANSQFSAQSPSLFTMRRPKRGKSELPAGRDIPRFTEVGVAKTRWDFFSAGLLVQVTAVFILFWIPILLVRAVPPSLKYDAVPLISAPLTEYKPPPPPPPKEFLREIRPKVAVAPKPVPVKPALAFEPRLLAPKPAPVPRAEAPVVMNSFESKLDVKPSAPAVRRPIETGVVSTGSSATPTLTNRPLNQVQTGGFGDPNGVPAGKNPNTRAANINTVGSFDLPGGPGYGNGTGGAKGARGTVASAGFGNGIATSSPQQPGPQRGVQSTGFGDVAPVANTEARPRAQAQAAMTPVEVLAKPNPVYTEEARKLRIEGNVKLRVVFLASGELQILGVTQSLGHGLDEAAVAAARRIRFRPAQEGGRAVDQPAIVTIEFKLAY